LETNLDSNGELETKTEEKRMSEP